MGERQESFNALMGRLDTVTNDIAADYEKLLGEAENNSVTAESIAAGHANVDRLKALGDSVANPVPEPPAPPEPPV